MLLVGLGILMALPHPVAAQGTCEGASNPTAASPPANPLATLELASTATTTKIACSDLNQGLELDLNGAQITTTGSNTTLSIEAEGDGDKDVKVAGSVTVNSAGNGIEMVRDGAGLLELNLGEKSTITSSGGERGISLLHKGKAGKTKGINIVSSANIDVSGSSVEGKTGIWAEVSDAPAGAIVPITIHLTGGYIYATSRPPTSGEKNRDQGKGVVATQAASGDITITVEPGVNIGAADKFLDSYGLETFVAASGTSGITIKHMGKIYATHGIIASKEDPAEGRTDVGGDVLIETGVDSEIVTRFLDTQDETNENAGTDAYGIQVQIDGEAHTGDVTIIHRGTINAADKGIWTYSNEDVTVTLEKGSSITSKDQGIDAGSNGSGKVMITHGGTIDATKNGISTYSDGDVTVTLEKGSSITSKEKGIYAGSNGSGKVMITHRGTIDAAENGISAYSDGDVMVMLEKGSRITSKDRGIDAWSNGGGTVTIIHRGTIDVAKNGIQATGDGKFMIVIGAQALVQSESGVAIEMEPMDATGGDINLILEKDEDGFVGRVKGKIIQDTADRTVKFETRMGMDGAKEDLNVGDHVYSRGDRMGAYDKVIKAQLTTIEDPAGYEFKDVPGDWRLYSQRARLYEVVPSVLLGLVELTPYSTRMAVPRRSIGDEEVMVQSSKGEHVAVPGSRTGVWVRLAVRDGERMADTSTTATDFRRQSLAWDVKQTGFEAGLEVPTDERLVLGVSAHYRQSEATVKRGGTMEASGTGLGVSLTWTDDSGLYVDGQLSYTRFFDITMVSANGAVGAITSTGGGNGLAVGVEVGQPMTAWGLNVIPRGGLSWSSVDMDAFEEPTTIDGAGTVAPGTNDSVQGRVGVKAELGPEDADGRLYASLDLEHEFSSKHAVMVAGTRLETEVKPTWVRLGVGGAMSLDGRDTTLLTGDAFYATAGSNNTDFGGGLSVTFRF